MRQRSDEWSVTKDGRARLIGHGLVIVLALCAAVFMAIGIVVRQRATSSAQVRAALRTMNTIPCLGTVLNGVQSNVPRWLRTSDEIWAYDSR